jgi:toxin secretion/phage lysis holin
MKWENILSFLGAAVGFLFGSNQDVLRIVTILCILELGDIISGLMKAGAQKNISSYKWGQGIFKKVAILLLVSICYFVDSFKLINAGVSLEAAVAVFFAVGEFISILENFMGMGLKLPQVLMQLFEKGQEELSKMHTPEPFTGVTDKGQVRIRDDTGESDGQ